MLVQNKLFRLAAWTAVAGLVLGPAVPPVYAQAAPLPGTDQAEGPEVTPPLRVGRLAWTQGTVSFHTADQDNWSPAVVNYPVTQGSAFWTQPGAEAGLQVSDVLLALSPTTELDIDTLDETNVAATEPQGEVYLRVRSLTPNETYTLQTPRGTVTIATPGRYEIAAGSTNSPTLVTVLEGAAQVSGTQPIDVPPGQTAVITGDQEFQTQFAPAQRDEFLNAMLAREQQQRPVVAATVPPLVAQMPGGDELAQYGSWSQTPDYGQVWYPQVQAGWQPYREGHWAYVAPWGWTWIDDDPWGFAPFHYGRWAQIDGRWAWIPGTEVVAEAPPQPVYAPALVAFFGVGLGLAAGAAFAGSVGWCPLGPNEVWHPWFRTNQRYIRDVNIRHVTNITSINTTVNNVTINNFRNARAATVVPAATMVTSQRVRPVARTIAPQELARVRPVVGRQPLPPTTATLGVTPAVARQMHIAAPPPGVAVPRRAEAPGPAIRGPVATAQPGQHPANPRLRGPEQAATAGAPHGPATVPAGPPAAERPTINEPRNAPGLAHETPALRAPGAGQAGPPPVQHEPGRNAGLAHATPELRAPGAGQAGPPPVQHEPGRTAGLATPHSPAPPGAASPVPTAIAPRAEPHVANTPPPHLAAPNAAQVHAPSEPPHATAHAAPPLRPTEPTQHATIEAPHPAPVPHPAAVPHLAPPTVAHAPPPVAHPVAPQVAIHQPAPPPVVHQPQVAQIPHPAPMPAPRPPEIHAAPPPPHVAAAAPAPAPAPQQHHQKRPGEP